MIHNHHYHWLSPSLWLSGIIENKLHIVSDTFNIVSTELHLVSGILQQPQHGHVRNRWLNRLPVVLISIYLFPSFHLFVNFLLSFALSVYQPVGLLASFHLCLLLSFYRSLSLSLPRYLPLGHSSQSRERARPVRTPTSISWAYGPFPQIN